MGLRRRRQYGNCRATQRSDGHRRGYRVPACGWRHLHRRQRQQRRPRGRSLGHNHHNRGGLRLGRGYSGDGQAATSAQLDDPTGLAVCGQYLFIADTGNNVIRRVDLSTGHDLHGRGGLRFGPATAVTRGTQELGRLPSVPSSTGPRASRLTPQETSTSPTPPTTSSARSIRQARSPRSPETMVLGPATAGTGTRRAVRS